MSQDPNIPVLPKSAYTSRAWYEREMRELFSNTWQFAGFVEDVAAPGDTLVVQAGLNNLFIVKGRDQRLRAFHNICRHRGTQLLRATGKSQKAITCPYHDWTYSLNGELLSVPEASREFPDLDKSCLGLLSASVETWLGMIWVHPDPNAESLLHWLAGAEAYIGPHRAEELPEYPEARTDHIIQANWKIVVENYIDVYHLSHLHSQTLYMYDHQKAEFGFMGPHFVFYEPHSKAFSENLEEMAPMPLIDHFDEANPTGAYVPMLFPNLGIGASESSWSIFHILPLAPDRTRVITRTRVANVSDWAFQKQEWRSWKYYKKSAAKYADAPVGDPMASGDFMAEDIFACESQQKAMNSPYFQVGASAKFQESSVRGFQSVVKQWMARTPEQEAGV